MKRRRIAIAVLMLGALAAGFLLLSGGTPPEQERAAHFAAAWERGDYAGMYAQLSDAGRRTTPLARFTAAYRRAAATATMQSLRAGRATAPKNGVVTIPIVARTRVFGTVRATLRLPFTGSDDAARVDWASNLTFPGVSAGVRLERRMRLPARADILARNGSALARGPDRGSNLGAAATSIVGSLDVAPPERRSRLRELGIPADTKVGVTGLERVFDEQLSGTPGGVLRAGGMLFATSRPKPGAAVRTTIDPDVQRAAVAALGNRLGGVAVVRPRSGEILALAGAAFSGLSPPGSTFKIVTLTGVLQAGLAGNGSSYPVATKATLEGVDLANAGGESCGGTLIQAFAQSCNSVFAPLGAKLGAERLVQTAEAFGFNEDLGIPGAATSMIPRADQIGDSLAVGSSAIGQGRVQATALQMALVASTIAARGRRAKLTLKRGGRPRARQVIPARTARLVTRYMEAVVRYGTGTSAALPGIRVAGKTGTAELRSTQGPACVPTAAAPDCPPAPPDDPTDTNAWFAAFAPANAPRVAVGVLLAGAGKGGDTAAPVAREVLLAGLRATH